MSRYDLLVGALFLALPISAYAVPLSDALALPILAIAVLAAGLGGGAADVAFWRQAAVAWLPLLGWMVLSASWSASPEASLRLAAGLAVLCLSGGLLAGGLDRVEPRVRHRWMQALAAGFCCVSAVTIAEAFDGAILAHWFRTAPAEIYYMAGYSRGAALHALVLVPLTLGLWHGGARRLAVAQAVLGVASILTGYQLAAKTALILAGLVCGAIAASPRLRWAVPGALLVLLLLLPAVFPVAIPDAIACRLVVEKPSALHRLFIWNFVGERIRERPVLGWGLDAARRIPGGNDHVTMRRCGDPPDAAPRLDGTKLPLHPHNAILQIWLELGGIGALAVCLCAVPLVRRAYRTARFSTPAGAAMLGAFLVAGAAIGEFSFGIWQEWWIGALFMGGALTASLAANTVPDPPPS